MRRHVNNIRSWLCREKPKAVRCVDANEQTREIECNGRWTDTSRAIVTLAAVRIEALDAKGKTLNVVALEREDDAPGEGDHLQPATALQSDLQFFGKLLSEAYRHSNTAFGQLVDVLKLSNQRLEKVEQALNREFSLRLKMSERLASGTPVVDDGDDDDDQAGAGGQLAAQMLQQFMLASAQGAGAAGASANGAKTKTKGGAE